MNYPLPENNWICRRFGHRFGEPYQDLDAEGKTTGVVIRRTCWLDGHTVPPFRKLRQVPPYDYLPDDQQPAGAV
jgi:hypothetical protein